MLFNIEVGTRIGFCALQIASGSIAIVLALSGCAAADSGFDAGKHSPTYLKSCPPHAGQQEDPRRMTGVRPANGRDYISVFSKLTSNSGEAGFKLFHALSVEPDKAIPAFSNRTRLRFDKHHGNQVTYSTNDGRIFLWYPGNSIVLRGRWMICAAAHNLYNKQKEEIYFEYAKACFRYDTASRNPATGERGNHWSCAPAGLIKRSVTETREGDVFKLETRRTPPFSLSKSTKQTINEIEGRMR